MYIADKTSIFIYKLFCRLYYGSRLLVSIPLIASRGGSKMFSGNEVSNNDINVGLASSESTDNEDKIEQRERFYERCRLARLC
jgi:hypothetical protein